MESLSDFWTRNLDAIIVGVLGGIVVAVIIGVWSALRKRVVPDEPQQVQIVEAPDPDKIAKRRFNNLDRPTAHYQGDAALIRRVMETLEQSHTASLVGLAGMGGIGKTEAALVSAWAMLEQGRFQDGALLLNLEGFSETGQPLSHENALRRLRTMIGVPTSARPDNVSEEEFVAALAEEWRQQTSGLDLLVILDNAKDSDHVRPLLPGADGPRVLITSRNEVTLPGLADSIQVARLDDGRAEKLTRAWAPELADAEVAQLVAVSLHLPLLIETIARAVQTPGLTPAQWLAKFEEAGAGIGLSEIEQVKARLALSIDALGQQDADRFAALSLFPGGFHAKSAFALWDLEDVKGAEVLGRIVKASLLLPDETPFEQVLGPIYRLHDYLAAAAGARFGALDDDTRRPYRHRWGQHALQLLRTAEDLFQTKGGDMAGLALFELERETIEAAQAWAVDTAATDDIAANLSMRFPNFGILDLRLTPRQNIAWLEAGLPAAKRLGNRGAEAVLLGAAGYPYRQLGEFETAEEILTAALAIETELGNHINIAVARGNLGNVYREQGKLDQAAESVKASLEISEALSREAAERKDEAAQREADQVSANTYGDLGSVYQLQEDYAAAVQSYEDGLAINRRLGDRLGEARKLGNLGNVYQRQDNLDAAAKAYQESLKITDEMGAKDSSAIRHFNLAILRAQQGKLTVAREHADTARALYAEVGLDHKVAETDELIAKIDTAMNGG